MTTDDEYWLFTCECSIRDCGRIYSGVLVTHQEGLVIWRSPECLDRPIAVFDQRDYRKVVLSAVKSLLRTTPKYSGLNWTMGVSPKYLRRAMDWARAGKAWT